ncbi:MAG: class I tRNA ligase family protein, partial [Candidatus Micrarchaeota archaeon]|nr:class I tRNA ligase family protein [Candidatus Micrarchaeota archaeon]
CISRQRYWGIPMPIWRCASCGKTTIIGSISELKENAANPAEIDALSDLHRPYIDRIKVKCECGAQKERIKDILDVWFDSSSAFRASLTAEQFGKFSSPELIVEYVEQIRGWFQYMLKCSMMVYGKKPFNHIVVHGILFGLDGRKMSKSFGNYKPLSEMTKMVTADAFRLWCVNYNPILNRNLNEMEIKESEKAVVILHNISNLISEYQDAAGYTPKLRPKIKTKGLDELDLWIVSRTESLVEGVTNSLEHYEAFKAASAIKDFVIDDLSRFYLKLAKKRILYGDKKQAKTILDISYYVLYRALILSSIITPFIAESVYLDRYSAEREKSIFMERWPKPDTSKINRQLEEDMDIVKDTITALLSSREKADISLRWPIAKATVEVSDEERIAQLQKLAGIVEGAVNAKQIEVKKSEGLSEVVRPVFARLGPVFKDKANAVADALKSVDARELRSSLNGRGSFSLKTQSGEFEISPDQVSIIAAEAKGDAVIYKYGSAYVDREISKELREEALVREFERGIQVARKEMGLRKADKINVVYKAQEGISELIRNNSAKIKSDVGALSIQAAEIIEEQHFSKEFEIEDGKVTIGVERLRR